MIDIQPTIEMEPLSDVALLTKTPYEKEVIDDFWICCVSREASLLARKEVLTGKAKFGITGDGKEVPQVAMAKAFKKGDWRSGYYRDQTFMMALGLSTVEDFFAQLYADANNDPFSGGRQMNSHYATETVDKKTGEWTEHKNLPNISSDISCTAGQMARGLGLALASKKYRDIKELSQTTPFSNNGNEVVFCTIGDASTSEGVFWETMNAAGVTRVPLAVSVWDDGYGISVPIEYQTTKGSISEVMEGFRWDEEKQAGIYIIKANGGNYKELCEKYLEWIPKVRKNHIPALFHVKGLTQPQGHSTSGSHERYKDKERLKWENENDCIKRMGEWMVREEIVTEEEIVEMKKRAKKYAKECRNRAWKDYNAPIRKQLNNLLDILDKLKASSPKRSQIKEIQRELNRLINPVFSELLQLARRVHFLTLRENSDAKSQLLNWLEDAQYKGYEEYNTHLYSTSDKSALKIPVIAPKYTADAPMKSGYEILNQFFEMVFEKYPETLAFGEDVGYIGDVNQGFAGLQEVFGKERIFDTGIREWTIMGQGIGLAMRGFRPIAEIQYLDYLIYGLEPLTDDLATLRYRSNGIQQAPAIIRTRGHRLEGIWHAGSPMGMLLGSLRGMYVLVPRNMTQAAGFYNTLLQSDDPALVIECLNGYRLKEQMPSNLGEYTVPLGVPEILQRGTDVTLVTYGSCIRVAQEGIKLLEQVGISVELIDVQSLLPFDLEHRIVESLKKTNRVVFMDEDVPGGGTAFMMQQVLEKQKGFRYLDSEPVTLTAKAHRPAYGSDGDYFSKPNPEDVFEAVYKVVYEAAPYRFK